MSWIHNVKKWTQNDPSRRNHIHNGPEGEPYLESFKQKISQSNWRIVRGWKGRQGLIMQIFESNGEEFGFLSIIGSCWTPIRLSVDFSAEILQAGRKWDDIFEILKEKICKPRILYLAKSFCRNEGNIKTFPNTQMLKEFITTRPALKEC